MLWNWIRNRVRQAILGGVRDALEALGEADDLPEVLAELPAPEPAAELENGDGRRRLARK